MNFIQYISKFSGLWNTSGWGDGGFVCIDISFCYQNLAALMLIFTFLSTLLKYMVVAALWDRLPISRRDVALIASSCCARAVEWQSGGDWRVEVRVPR